MHCKHATRLLSDAQDRQLPWQERLALHGHLLICRGCRRFRQQIDFLRQACRHYRSAPTQGLPEGVDGDNVNKKTDSM